MLLNKHFNMFMDNTIFLECSSVEIARCWGVLTFTKIGPVSGLKRLMKQKGNATIFCKRHFSYDESIGSMIHAVSVLLQPSYLTMASRNGRFKYEPHFS